MRRAPQDLFSSFINRAALIILAASMLESTPALCHDYVYIGGNPEATIAAGHDYAFTPWLSTPASSRPKVRFSVHNKPYWASFNERTGTLSGIVRAAQVGTYKAIGISATDGKVVAHMPTFSITVTSSAGSPGNPPKIGGTPAGSVVAGTAYSFTPTASDASGRKLTFSVRNAPSWASFSTANGLLSGTPTTAAEGTTSNIVISVSDGQASASLPAFSITVTGPSTSTHSATLSWSPPTTNVDGTPLTNLAGYIINYGTSAGALTQSVQLAGAGTSQYTLSNLAAGTWFFDIVSYTNVGVRSSVSAVVSAVVK